VTARRREESLQDVPVSVVAFGAEQIAERQLRTEADLQRTVPGLTIRETEGSNQITFSMRGQTLDAFTGGALAVVPYVNEVQANGNAASNFYDLESIQTLKGPQGTLFGRNATGGAVLFATAKPVNEFTGSVSGTYGNYDYVDLTGVLNIPLVSDTVLLRLAGNFARRDGYQKNIFSFVPDSPTRRLGKLDRKSGRASLTLKPGERFTNTTVFEYTKTGGNSTSVVPWSVNLPGSIDPETGLPLATSAAFLYSPEGLNSMFGPTAWDQFLAAHPGANPLGYAAAVERQKQLGPWKVDVTSDGFPYFFRGRNWYLTNTSTFDLAEDVLIKNIFGYTKSRSHYNISEQGAPYFVQCTCNVASLEIGNLEKTRAWSNELQLQGKLFGGALDYIVGGYYYKARSLTHWPQTYFDVLPFIPPNAFTAEFKTRNQSKALFAQVTYDLSTVGLEGLSVTAGGRYTWEKVRLEHTPNSNQFNIFPTNSLQVKFKKPSWTIGIDYQATPDLLLYAVHRGSWRSGGLNGVAPLLLADAAGGGAFFRPETAKDVELGAKWGGRLLDRPARFNIAAYKMWVKNIQRAEFPIVDLGDGQGPHSIAVTINVPEAQIKGIEVDAAFQPFEGLEIGGNGAYTDAKYTEDRVLIFGNLFVFGPYADTPKWSGTLYGQVTLPLDPSSGSVRLRGDIYAQTKQYFSNNNSSITPGTKLPGYSLINARLDWSEIMGSGFSANLFVRNLTKKKYFVGGLSQGASLGENAAAPGRPRMYGLEVKYAW
jgi:iron complex outermembrane receptor protein